MRWLPARYADPLRGDTPTELALQSKVPLSLLRLRLHTGLKHQLRVHLAQYLRSEWSLDVSRLLGDSLRPSAPILGDNLYMNTRAPILKEIKSQISIPWGLFLHSSRFSLHVRPHSSYR